MKLAHTLIATAALAASALAHAQAASQEDCNFQHERLTSEMEKAKSAGEDARMLSLERARGELAVSCSEPGARTMKERRISTQEKKVTQMQKAVDSAEKDGKGDATKARANLKEAQAELERMKREAPKKTAQQKGAQTPEQARAQAEAQPKAPQKN